LPDGKFSNQESQFGHILEGLGTENVGIHILCVFGLFDSHVVYLKAIWYVFPFWYILPIKIWHTACDPENS
jgi:hypothetical protein